MPQIGTGNTTAKYVTVTIANGASLSGEADLSDARLVGIILPSNISSATALTFQAGAVSGSLSDMYTSTGSELSYTVAASRYIVVDPADFVGAAYLKVRTGTSGSPTTQGADRTITLICNEL